MATSGEYGRHDFGQGGLNDGLDVGELVDEIGLDGDEIAWRKEFVGFDAEDERRLSRYEDAFAENAEQIADGFYENLTEHEQTTAVIGRSDKGLEQLKRTQSAYLVTLAGGEYGTEYFEDRARIGKIHDMLEMPMKHYIGQYGVYYDLILPLIGDRLVDSLTDRLAPDDGGTVDDETAAAVEAEVDDAIEDLLSVLRIVNLDMQVVTDTYIHSYSEKLSAAVERNEELMAEVEAEVEDPISDLRESAGDVAESAAEVGDAAEEQSRRVAEVSSEVANLSATVEEVASTADEVDRTSSRAEALAEDGRDAADDAASAMDDIGDAVDEVAADVEALQERVEEIDEFVDAIDGIADQTNLLALNASIEAARAGEAGAGFGVVADEIKSLAEESQGHASDIESMVDGIRADTEETVESLSETTVRVDEGSERVGDAAESLTDIAEAVTETADGIDEVSDVTDEQAAAAEEIAATIDGVVEQSNQISERMGELAEESECQSAAVEEVERSVRRLSADGGDDGFQAASVTDGGRSIPAGLPEGMPEFVIDRLSDEELQAIAAGDLEMDDLR
ncbi:globin-coupled sensor protein [Halorubrum sp. SD690R]|uniref:globin-coupled sensor protein n=1 Tax=Halorubrum sp. SD690R TaxID=2518117 RepID=UPI001F53EF4F|nr:globin-coupled sensor protein [Halorubrum sp. SD690R]